MNDEELHAIAPRDPARAHPGWPEARRRILTEIASDLDPVDHRGKGPRWWAVAAAAVLVIGAGVFGPAMLPHQQTNPAGPPSASTAAALHAGTVLVLQADEGLVACPPPSITAFEMATAKLPSRPPSCAAPVALVDIGWPDLPWATGAGPSRSAEARLLGFPTAEGALRVTSVQRDTPIAAADLPLPPLPALCSSPAPGRGSSDEALTRLASGMPGYIGRWQTPDGTTQLAFRNDSVLSESDRAKLIASTKGAVCIGNHDGLTVAEAHQKLSEVQSLPGVLQAMLTRTEAGTRLHVLLPFDTPSAVQRVREVAGNEAWPAVNVQSVFVRVTPAPSASPTR